MCQDSKKAHRSPQVWRPKDFGQDYFLAKEMESVRKLLPEVSGFAGGYVNLRPNR